MRCWPNSSGSPPDRTASRARRPPSTGSCPPDSRRLPRTGSDRLSAGSRGRTRSIPPSLPRSGGPRF
ncbi:hypothetical protein ACFFX0_08740 [Citricoccus parietis]|uniref:Uncharacterized protein n=1 Tax=Citricoccus parietis TaxID=592307 RepID=A0ABV5FX60_9MICC